MDAVYRPPSSKQLHYRYSAVSFLRGRATVVMMNEHETGSLAFVEWIEAVLAEPPFRDDGRSSVELVAEGRRLDEMALDAVIREHQ